MWFLKNDIRKIPDGYSMPLTYVFDDTYCHCEKLPKGYLHEYDLGIFFRYLELVIEMDGDHDFKFGDIKGKRTRHSKTNQKINDGVAKKYIETRFPYAKFLRLKKEDVLNPATGQGYLMDEFIKLYYL